MSDIRPGDLVMVVRWPCCGQFLGVPFIVGDVFGGAQWYLRCDSCGVVHEEHLFAENRDGVKGSLYNVPLTWLKKIDPPTIDETTDEREELTV